MTDGRDAPSTAQGAGRTVAGERDPAPRAVTATFDRALSLARLGAEHFDVLVIGGGITGAGVALDAASRGMRTALVEKGDFASGTSSKSSKMVHGGLRYLQQHEFRLVYESLAERQRLLQNASHLVTPLPFLIPMFGLDGVVARTVARSLSTALWLYDLTGGFRIGARHRRLSRAEVLEHFPALRPERLVDGFLYFDARADDARLTLALLRTAALDHGAVVANYAELESLVTDASGRVAGGVVRPFDPVPTPDGVAPASMTVRARCVVNASGVWADEVRTLGRSAPEGSRTGLRPAKGIHVTVPAERLPCDIAAVLPVPGDRRSIFVVPWPEGGLVYVGTTDTAYQGPLDDPACTPEDVAYLLDAVNLATTSDLRPDDVTGIWAGLRPLLDPGPGRRVRERTADLSRRHRVDVDSRGLVTVTGGKLTTYRAMAEDAVDQAARLLPGGPRPRAVTKTLALRGAWPAPAGPARPLRPARPRRPGAMPGAEGPGDVGALRGLDPARRAHLLARYGTEAADVVEAAGGRTELLEPLIPQLPYLGAEVVYAARSEMARTIADVALRRTRAGIQRAGATIAAAGAIGAILAGELGWSAEEERAEVERFRRLVAGELEGAGAVSSGRAAR